MTEEVKPVEAPVEEAAPVTEATKAETPEYSPVELEMMDQGWKPRDQFEGEDDDFVTAPEYKRRGELFKKIADQNRRIERVSSTLTQLQQHQKQMYQAGYEQALKELRSQHEAAVEAGDAKEAAAIVQKIETTKEQALAAKHVQIAPQEVPAVMTEFLDSNASWYQKDDVMTAYADALGHKYAQEELRQGRQPTVDGVLAHVQARVREKFPQQFGGKRSALPPAVGPASSPTRVAPKRAGFSVDDLSDVERQSMRRFVEDGVMTADEYVADIKKMRGIK